MKSILLLAFFLSINATASQNWPQHLSGWAEPQLESIKAQLPEGTAIEKFSLLSTQPVDESSATLEYEMAEYVICSDTTIIQATSLITLSVSNEQIKKVSFKTNDPCEN